MKNLLALVFIGLLGGLSAYAEIKYSDRDSDLISEALGLMDSGKSSQAIAILDSLIRVYPGDNVLLYECAYAYHLNGDEADCIAMLKPLYDAGTVTPEENQIYLLSYSLLGSAYFNNGQLDKSNEVFANAIERWPAEGILYYNYGVNQLKDGDEGKALATFERGIKNAPEWKSNYRGALALSMQSGTISKSIFYITSLVLLDPSADVIDNLLPLIPQLLNSMVKEKDEGGYDITINKDSSSTSGDLMMALFAAAATIDKENQEGNDLDRIVKNLKSSLALDLVLDIPVIDYLKSMESDDETLLDSFWYFLMGLNYPIEFQDWSESHQAELSALAQWISEHPFPQPKL